MTFAVGVYIVNFTSQWLADWSDFGLLKKQSSPKWEIPCPRRRWTSMQNLTPPALSSPEKSVTVQTHTITKKKLAYRHVWIISKSLSLSTAELVKQRSATSSVKFRFSVVWYTSVIDCRNHKSATDRFTVLRCVVLAHYRTQYQHCSIAVYTLTDSGQANLP